MAFPGNIKFTSHFLLRVEVTYITSCWDSFLQKKWGINYYLKQLPKIINSQYFMLTL